MKTAWARILLLAMLAGLGVWGWRALHPRPEQAIRRRLNSLAKLASFSEKESQLASLYTATRLAAFFTKDVQITLDVPGAAHNSINGRDELQAAIAASRGLATSLSLQFVDIVVQIGADQRSSSANLTVRGKVSGDKDVIVQELKLFLKKVDGDWLISRVESVKTLQ